MAAENRGPELAACVIILLVFATITVCLRCYTRRVLLKVFFAEDWLAVVTLLFYISYSTCALVSIGFGLGQHVDNVPEPDRIHALLWKYLALNLYVVVSALVKILVGLFLLRICSQQKWQRVTIWTLLAVVATFNIFYLFTVIFQCLPIEYYWYRYTNPQVVAGGCTKTDLATVPTYISLFLNVFADWLLALLPVSFVYKAKMPFKTKCSVVAVLALGAIASLATIARIPFAKQILHSPDYLYNFTDLGEWSTVEIGTGLIASSLATLKPLFSKFKLLDFASRSNITGTAGLTRDTRNSALHSRKRSNMGLGLGHSRNFEEIIEDENELSVLEKGPKVQLRSVLEEVEPLGPRNEVRWDERIAHGGSHVRPNTHGGVSEDKW